MIQKAPLTEVYKSPLHLTIPYTSSTQQILTVRKPEVDKKRLSAC
jgi:hypothetical protein